jgi:hypothetical protein
MADVWSPSPESTSIWICLGVSSNVIKNPGFIIGLGPSGGYIAHMKGPQGWVDDPSLIKTCGVERSLLSQSCEPWYCGGHQQVWLIWCEGLLFVGSGSSPGHSLIMAADTACNERTYAIERNRVNDIRDRYATDEVCSLYVGSGDLPGMVTLTSSSSSTSAATAGPYSDHSDNENDGDPVTWKISAKAGWRNSPCRYTRALSDISPALPEPSPKDKPVYDTRLGRVEYDLYCRSWPMHISLAELVWWLRFVYVPVCAGAAARRLAPGREESFGHSIDVEHVRKIGMNRDDLSCQIIITVRMTRDIYKTFINTDHQIKDSTTTVRFEDCSSYKQTSPSPSPSLLQKAGATGNNANNNNYSCALQSSLSMNRRMARHQPARIYDSRFNANMSFGSNDDDCRNTSVRNNNNCRPISASVPSVFNGITSASSSMMMTGGGVGRFDKQYHHCQPLLEYPSA